MGECVRPLLVIKCDHYVSYLHVGVVVIKQQGLGRSHVLRREPSAVTAVVLRRGQGRVVGGKSRVAVYVAVLRRVEAGRRYHGWLNAQWL